MAQLFNNVNISSLFKKSPIPSFSKNPSSNYSHVVPDRIQFNSIQLNSIAPDPIQFHHACQNRGADPGTAKGGLNIAMIGELSIGELLN